MILGSNKQNSGDTTKHSDTKSDNYFWKTVLAGYDTRCSYDACKQYKDTKQYQWIELEYQAEWYERPYQEAWCGCMDADFPEIIDDHANSQAVERSQYNVRHIDGQRYPMHGVDAGCISCYRQ